MAQGGGVKTGCIVRHEDKFYLFAGASKDGVQVVGLWLSDDLDNWKQHPANPVLRPAGPYYRDTPTRERPSVSWRDPGIAYCREDGCYHMFLSAQSAERDARQHLGTVIGHVVQHDTKVPIVRFLQQAVEGLNAAEHRMDVGVVCHITAEVDHR